MKTTRIALATALSLLGLAATVAVGRDSAPGPCFHGTVSRLYLGQETPAGNVSEAQWRGFVAESVTPRFPAGFTEFAAHGHWRDERGRILQEPTRIVEVAHDDSPAARASIHAIAGDYRRRFAQQSVLVMQSSALHCFEEGAS